MSIIDTLTNKDLMPSLCFVNGEWTDMGVSARVDVINPADGAVIGSIPSLTKKEVDKAVDAAAEAFKSFKGTLAEERANLLKKWHQLIIENQDDLALMLTAEMGKPLEEARGEILYTASFIEWFAEEARRVRGDIIATPKKDRRILTLREPVGVVAAITPWNFPSAMIARKMAPALAAGCTVVVKPAARTPYSAFGLAKLAEMAGFPKGTVNVVTGAAKEVGEALTAHPEVRKVSFTGSTNVGKLLMRQCADTVKKLSLELGGNAPFIVFEDADIDYAVEQACASKYRNAGQACTSTNRIYVHENVQEAFTKKMVEKVSKFKVCNGLEKGADQGPLISMDAVNKVQALLKDAVDKGATIQLGGKPHELGGTFFEPTVISGVTQDMEFAKEEIFGPVSAIFTFKTEEEVTAWANDTNYGLAAYFYTQDQKRIWRMSEALEYGMVGANEALMSTTVAPFGGMKESGIGREGSHLGMDEYVEVKYVCVGGL
jgi:succinate-semialdehyde dehydrogenase/glutarate-semialdehyde dehydrogenase